MKGILWAVPADAAEADALLRHGPERAFAVAPHAHITLRFGVKDDAEDVLALVGRKFVARLTGVAADEGIQALVFELPGDIPCGNAHPHLTWSHREGVKPVRSNDLLASGVGRTPLPDTDVRFRVEFSPFRPAAPA